VSFKRTTTVDFAFLTSLLQVAILEQRLNCLQVAVRNVQKCYENVQKRAKTNANG